MSAELLKGKWHQFKGKVKEKWGKLTDNDITRINGKAEVLLGVLQEKYGWQKKQAEEELKRFESNFEQELNRPSKRIPFPEEGIYRKEHKEGGEGKQKKRKIV